MGEKSVDVHLVPMFGCDPAMKQLCDARGCVTHAYEPGIFGGRVVVSFCNGPFLEALPAIVEAGRPRAVVWFNCMTWTFPHEITAHANAWIDYHGFVSHFQRDLLKPQLEQHRPVRELAGYRPYYSTANASQRLRFSYRPPGEWFGVGRISRDDGAKFAHDTWDIFYKVCAPLPKKVFILGYGPNAHCAVRARAAGLDWQTWGPNEVPVREVYERLHAILHKTGGSRESYCRIVPEAYAAGVPLVVEDDFAFPDLIVNGVTGFLCKSSDEMSFRASELAFDEAKRKRVIFAAHDHLREEIASAARCWEAWDSILCS